MKSKCVAVVHGAISIVNAVATGFGSALGISLRVKVEIAVEKGAGVSLQSGNTNSMIQNIIDTVLSKDFIKKNHLNIIISSEIPIGVGLKSSSAVSCALSLACNGLLRPNIVDRSVIDAATDSSLIAKTTITGAYDDSSACYYGGLVVTDNFGRKVLRRDDCVDKIAAIIYIPRNSKRGDTSKLKLMADLYREAFKLASAGDYWKAMNLNGTLGSALLLADYFPARLALENGAIAASVTGNGPAIAAVAKIENINGIKSALQALDGIVMVSHVNNEKAAIVG